MDLNPGLFSGITALVRAELDQESAAGFPKLKRIPSTGIIRFLDYWESLPAGEHDPLIEALASLGTLHFFPAPLIAKTHDELRTTNPACLRMGAAMKSPQFAYGLRYEGLRMARAILNDPQSVEMMKKMRAGLDFEPRDDRPRELVGETDILQVRTAKAPLLRKLLKASLTPLLGAKGEKKPGGEIVYEGAIGRVPLKATISFSNLYAQMYYGVTIKMPERNILAFRVSYEAFWGTNEGWNYLTEENAPRSVELLCELVRTLAGFMERIAAMPVS